MHKVEIAGRAGPGRVFGVDYLFQSCWLSRVAARALGSRQGGGPESKERRPREPSARRQKERCDGALCEMAPTWRNEQRIKADAAQEDMDAFLVIAACPQRCDADG